MIGWHRIGNLRDGLTITASNFEAQLDRLLELEAKVLPLESAVRSLGAGTLPPRAVALTFDDGYASVLEHAWPLLKARNMPMSFFVVPGYLGGDRIFPWDRPGRHAQLLTAAEIEDAASDGVDIQSHTMDHRWLPGGADHELKRDLHESRDCLEQLLQRSVRGLAYPAGGWDRRVRRLSGESGYTYALTVDRGINDVRGADPLALRRPMAPDTADELELLLKGGYDHLRPLDTMRRRVSTAKTTRAGW